MVRSCIKFAGALAIVLGFASATYAQDAAATDNVIRPLTKSGSAAMLFTLGGFGTFGVAAPVIATAPNGSNFGGGNTASGAGLRYFFADDMALRVLIAFGSTSTGADSLTSGAVSTLLFGIGAGVEWHMRPLYSTSPYIGVQIGFVSASQTTTNRVPNTSGGKDVDTKISASQFNAALLAGFDWFFTRGIAIGAEYQLGFATTSSSTTVAGTTANNPSTTGIGIGLASGASVHAVVYF
jgi:hypothetical protein